MFYLQVQRMKTWWSPSPVGHMCCLTPATTAPYTLLRKKTLPRNLQHRSWPLGLLHGVADNNLLFFVLVRSVECETSAPVADNKLFCDQCFCYICDKLASLVGVDLLFLSFTRDAPIMQS